jgi:predicted RNase H-like nuclease (RuvC/YqgF family)
MVQDDQQDEIIEGEVTSEGNHGESLDVPVSGADQASALLNLEELIKNHIDAIDKLKLELKNQREMLEDSFNSNPTYREHTEKVKEVTKAKNSVRQEIAKQPAVAALNQKVKDLRFDMNEQSKTLSDLLQDYHEQTGATSIETRDGKVLEIVSTARLVRRSS